MCASQNVPIWRLTEQRLIIIIVQNLFCAITDYCVENGKADWVAGDDFARKDGGVLMATMKVFARTSALGGREGTQCIAMGGLLLLCRGIWWPEEWWLATVDLQHWCLLEVACKLAMPCSAVSYNWCTSCQLGPIFDWAQFCRH